MTGSGGTRAGVLAGAMAMALSACGSAPLNVAAIDDMERARGGPGAQEGARLAPEAYARAEQERRIALEEHAAGDDVGAVLHAQRALAAYDHAIAVVRLARATTELADAEKALHDASTQAQTLEASHVQLEREAAELDERLRVTRERMLPAQSAAASPEREAARLVAARALAVEARLLCDAGRLVSADAAGLGEADEDVKKLDSKLAPGPRPAPIDDAARVRFRAASTCSRGPGAPRATTWGAPTRFCRSSRQPAGGTPCATSAASS